jgi:hypothetical protein
MSTTPIGVPAEGATRALIRSRRDASSALRRQGAECPELECELTHERQVGRRGFEHLEAQLVVLEPPAQIGLAQRTRGVRGLGAQLARVTTLSAA